MARWNSADHPRYPNGRFRPKLSQSVRLSPRSISYNAGVRVPVVPGRAQLYVGALVRLERVQGGRFGQRVIERGVNKVSGLFGDRKGSSVVARVLKGEDINVYNARVNLKVPVGTPTFRIQRAPGGRETFEVREAATERSPRRRPRARIAQPRPHAVPSTITKGIETKPPRAKKPRKRRRSDTSGRRVRR